MSSPRVLLFSQRNLYEIEVWRAGIREFEDLIALSDSVDILAPPRGRWFQPRQRLALRLGKHSSAAVNAGVPEARLDRDYDLFFAVCEKPSELLNVNAVDRWRERCRTSVCWLTELWVNDMPLYKSSLKVLDKFDYVFSQLSHSVAAIDKVIRGTCFYAPPAVDTLLFFPFAANATRCIDVYSLGRKFVPVHEALLRMARDNKLFYVHDTISDLHAYDLEQHRFLVASMAKRSRYFVVNAAKADSPHETGGQSEMGPRYVEGAAAGAILIGGVPETPEFTKQFPWPDAVVSLPSDPEHIEGLLGDLDEQPERQARIRRTNVAESLLRHDWVYRWETVLRIAGLEPLPALAKRKQRLSELAKTLHGSDVPNGAPTRFGDASYRATSATLLSGRPE
jgi:hypothetical protein